MKGPRSLGVVIKLGQSVGRPLCDRGNMPLTTLKKKQLHSFTRTPLSYLWRRRELTKVNSELT